MPEDVKPPFNIDDTVKFSFRLGTKERFGIVTGFSYDKVNGWQVRVRTTTPGLPNGWYAAGLWRVLADTSEV